MQCKNFVVFVYCWVIKFVKYFCGPKPRAFAFPICFLDFPEKMFKCGNVVNSSIWIHTFLRFLSVCLLTETDEMLLQVLRGGIWGESGCKGCEWAWMFQHAHCFWVHKVLLIVITTGRLWVSPPPPSVPPLNLHSQNGKVPFTGPCRLPKFGGKTKSNH